MDEGLRLAPEDADLIQALTKFILQNRALREIGDSPESVPGPRSVSSSKSDVGDGNAFTISEAIAHLFNYQFEAVVYKCGSSLSSFSSNGSPLRRPRGL